MRTVNDAFVLSRQETRVIELSMEGLGDKEIALNMGLSLGTVRTYWKRIGAKVGGSTRAEIVTTFARRNADEELERERTVVARLKREIAQRREAEERFRAICACSPIGIVVSDFKGACQYVNPAWERITGLRFETIEGDGWRRIVHPDDIPRVLAWAETGAASGSPEPIEYRFLVEGRSLWVRSNFSLMIVDGEIVGIVSTVENVDECVRSRQAAARETIGAASR